MASPSSPPRRGPRLDRQHVGRLLEDGARLDDPPANLLATAKTLQALGIITYRQEEYVRCTDPRDSDFSGRRSACPGQIIVDSLKDEDADDYECPKCGRTVYPNRHGKRRHRLLSVFLQRPGALAWLEARLREVSDNVKALGDDTFHVGGFGDLGVIVCAVDADGDPNAKFNRRSFAANNSVLYVTLNSCVAPGRLAKDDWIRRVSLADLLCETVDLRQELERCATAGIPQAVAAADMPVFAKGHVSIQPEEEPHKDRLFVVELDGDVVRVNGEMVVHAQAGPRLALFRILWKQFLDDMAAGKAAEEFAALNMRKLLRAMEDAGHRYEDETSLRKLVNNLQSDIEKAVKRKLGLPIGPQDIVQTCRATGQADTTGGYRINPFCVAVRPRQSPGQPDLSEKS